MQIKKSLYVVCFILTLGCQEKIQYASYGETITSGETLAHSDALRQYNTMNIGDTLDIKIQATVKDVCKAKGCWMKLDLGEDHEAMVRFKDYGFFVPKDIEGEQVIIRGKAFVSEMSVKDQRHYAKDAGKSEEELLLITRPKKTFSFEADGVLIANYHEAEDR